MTLDRDLSTARDKLLFTPGPLTTSLDVKLAMMRDLGSRDVRFIEIVREVREGLLDVAGLAGAARSEWEAVLMQGSGTFGIESVIGSTVPAGGKLAVVANGAYGERMLRIARALSIDATVLRVPEDRPVTAAEVRDHLEGEAADATDVAIVHCETTSGLCNPIDEIGPVVRAAGKTFFVDAMSSFGAVPIDFEASCVDFLVSSANKCIEGVPGFSFAICRRHALEACVGRARSLSLDLHSQWIGLEANGQFRFTPPTHAILAFHRALDELRREGGVEARAARYRRNHGTLVRGMREMGFREFLPPERQGWIITSFRYPEDERFDFTAFYEALSELGCVIYPGKVSDADCFRVGNIGRITEEDVMALLGAIARVKSSMGF